MKFASTKVLTAFLFLVSNVAAEKNQKQPQKTHWNDKRLKAGDGKDRFLNAQSKQNRKTLEDKDNFLHTQGKNKMKQQHKARKLGDVVSLDWVGDGKCDFDLNIAEHSYDGGDCCPSTCQASTHDCSNTTEYDCYDPNAADQHPYVGDGFCDHNFNTADYNYDEGDCCPSTCQFGDNYNCTSATKRNCQDPSTPEYLPNPWPEVLSENHPWVGDGDCDYELNVAESNFDGGDCCPSTCQVATHDCTTADKRACLDPSTPEYLPNPEVLSVSHPWIGDGECDHDLNMAEYNFDGGDCCPSTCQIGTHDCSKTTEYDCYDPSAPVRHPHVGDGDCDISFNTAEFDYDEGDCCSSTCQFGENYNCTSATKRSCLDPSTPEFLPNPEVLSESHPWIGDGECDYELNTAEYNFDEGDCCPSTCQVGVHGDCSKITEYDCHNPNAADLSPSVGDGYCDDTFNTAGYNYDEGDCCPSTCRAGVEDCTYTTKRDCQDPSAVEYIQNPEVLSESHPWVGDGECDYELNTPEFGFDGGDCCLSTCQVGDYDCSKTTDYDCYDPNAPVRHPHVGDGDCDHSFNTAEFDFDEGDCCPSTCQSSDSFDCSSATAETCKDPNAAASLVTSGTTQPVSKGALRGGKHSSGGDLFDLP